ncbi:MAG: D-tyrosyl-tRNA(Tyr) deacylase [SAR324 cluster bacterium]|nr:D-tyrosyl-tRNA(Tyr) deacylase [SAR324 cluster bacterium]
MRVLLQRVRQSSVLVEEQVIGQIGRGVLLLLGISKDDNEKDAKYLAEKCVNLRIFDAPDGKKNHWSVKDIGGDILVVSQFTLYGDCRKGRRPGFDKAARPEQANALYIFFVEQLQQHELVVQTGQFQAMMQVELINDGPVTYLLDS